VGIVAKPFDIDDLLRAVDAALSQNGSNLRLDILRQSDR
jgi:DNA-binding response OmpR family regulator